MRKILLSLLMLGVFVLNSYADFISWDGNVLTLDYTTGENLSTSTSGDSNENRINNSGKKDNITKVIIKSDADHKFPVSDLEKMINWSQNKIMDFTQALGIQESEYAIFTSQQMKCTAIYLPSNISFPDASVYAPRNSAWNTGEGLLYVCQLIGTELTVGATLHNGTQDAVAAALAVNPLQEPFSQATHITLVGEPTANDVSAVNTFNSASIKTAFDATTGTLTLSLSDLNAGKGIATIVTDLANLTNKNQINTIVFPDGTTYEVVSGKYTAAAETTEANTTSYKTWLTNNGYTVDGSFNAITGTLTLANLESNVSAFVSNTNLTSLSNKDQVNTIVFPDGSTYQVASGKYTAAEGSTNTDTYKNWLTDNSYTVDGSYDAASGTLTLANLSSSVSTFVSKLSDFNNKNDVQTIVFPDGSTYDVASQKLSAASTSTDITDNGAIKTWLTNNGYTVTTTEVNIGDFATWNPNTGVLTLDYTTGETLSTTLSGNSYSNLLGSYNNSIKKVVIKSKDETGKKFPVSDLGNMVDWGNGKKIMDFTQALGIDETGDNGLLTAKNMKATEIYLPSNYTFPEDTDGSIYANESATWNGDELLFVCQLLANGELIVGAADPNSSRNAVKAALDKNPLEYPFSEATHITLKGNPTSADTEAVNNFNGSSYNANTHTLNLSRTDLAAGINASNIGTIATSLNFSINDIQVIKFPDGSTYNVTSKTLTAAENSTNINDNIQWLKKNGYSDIVKTEIGKYVSVIGDKTILTIPDDEPVDNKDVVTSNIENSTKLTAAEKAALKAATNLVVEGPVTENDWGGLQHIAATTLDLTEAKIGNTFALANALRENVQNLTLPNDVNYTKVPDNFAYNAIALQSVTFPGQITEIGERAFFGCGNLASVDLPANLTTIGESAFQDSGLKTLVLPSKLTTVGTDAFFDCGQLENVEMKQLDLAPNTTCTFGDRAFGSCFQLKHITLSEGVDAISDQMFDKCSMLESIRIPSTCETIGQEAFNICASLHSIVIPEGVKLIKKQAFTNSGITDVYVMATSETTVPKIYSMGSNWGGNDSTFGSAMVTGNSHDPYDAHKDEIRTADGETVLSWYQEEMSDGRLGVGGGDCLVRLHYPEEMKYFYDGFNNPLTNASWTPTANDALSQDVIDAKMAVINAGNTHYISEGYTVGTEQYPAFGNDNQGNYWPRRTDYLLRLEAGDPTRYSREEPSSLGWRQLPLHQVSKHEDFIFTKEYDDTWYTMCFPWDMEDNTLFSAFNQKLEIVEFVGVEVKEETSGSTKQLNLVFHFDEVAGTYYMTEDHLTDGLEYERVEDYTVGGKNTTRTETINIAGYDVQKKYYTYHRIKGTEGPDYVYWPFNLPEDKKTYTSDQKAMVDRYNSILHLMVFAGHPYMIHPSVGAKPNNPVICSIAGVKKLLKPEDSGLTDKEYYTALAETNKVTKATTTNGTFQHPGTTYYDGQQSHYTFIGNIKDGVDQDDTTNKRSYMTDDTNKYAYFLAVDPTQSFYPKYYRKSKENEYKNSKPSWSQYSAIIRPDATALSDIEKYMNLSTNGSSSAKSFDIEFGKWEVVDVTAIEEIIAEAERKNQPVEQVHLNVVFNIKGQVIREGVDSVEGLPKGLYIVNGKKYMVK